MSETTDREKEIFNQALELATPEARAAFLKGACGNDPELREKIEALLRAYAAAAGFIPTKEGERTVLSNVSLSEGPGTRIGRYKLLQQIGEGGFGVVFMAEQEEPVRRRVALKVIKLGMDTKQVVARFEAERQALAMLDHPNIAKVFDAGATGPPIRSAGFQPAVSPTSSRQADAGNQDVEAAETPQAGSPATQQTGSLRYEPETHYGRPYFVMELVRGIPITRYCDENNLTTAQRLDLFLKVCQAISHAHQKGIIHRDIKPSNILVTLHDGTPVPKVIDFGIAKATEGRLTDHTLFTAFEQFLGTPAYMSPEQAELSGLDIDTRSDIYSLGVLLYELLTGATPFDAKELMQSGLDEMRRTIRETEPPKPSTRLTMELARGKAFGVPPSGGQARAESVRTQMPDAPPAKAGTPYGGRRSLQETKQLINLLRGDLDWIVMKALEKDRTRRYEGANGLALDVQRYLADEPVLARPPSSLYRFEKMVRRHKLAFAVASAVMAILVITNGFLLMKMWPVLEAYGQEETAFTGTMRFLLGVTDFFLSRWFLLFLAGGTAVYLFCRKAIK